MSGGFWAGAVPPWASALFTLTCILVLALGLLAGHSWGRRAEQRDQAEDRADEEAWRQVPQPATDQFAGIREAGRRAWAIQQQRAEEAFPATHEELASEWHDHPPLKWDDEGVPGCPACKRRWEVEETDEEFSARLAATADEIIAWAHAASDPGSSG